VKAPLGNYSVSKATPFVTAAIFTILVFGVFGLRTVSHHFGIISSRVSEYILDLVLVVGAACVCMMSLLAGIRTKSIIAFIPLVAVILIVVVSYFGVQPHIRNDGARRAAAKDEEAKRRLFVPSFPK